MAQGGSDPANGCGKPPIAESGPPPPVCQCPLLAEAVEEVPGSRILETMIQGEACQRIKVAEQASVMNHWYENSRCSDFFDNLGYLQP